MNPIDPYREQVADLCRRFGVQNLDLFGSATTDAFDPARSDLDFLVEFDSNPTQLVDRYFGLKESLETLTGRSVDLVTAESLENPYFIEAVNKSRQPVYAAEDVHRKLYDLMKDSCGVVDSGISDLGSNPKHLKEFGGARGDG